LFKVTANICPSAFVPRPALLKFTKPGRRTCGEMKSDACTEMGGPGRSLKYIISNRIEKVVWLGQAAPRSINTKLQLRSSKIGIFDHLFLIIIYQNLFKFYQITDTLQQTADFLG
jgi:hypothetical protein